MQFRMASTTLVAAALAASVVACSKGETADGTDTTAVATSAGTVTDSGVTTGAGTGVGPASTNNLNDPSTVTQLDAIISAAEGGLTALPGAAAISAIDPIREKLHNSGQPNLESIADDLDKLKDELDEDKIDGKKVGGILNTIAPKVTTAGSGAGAPPQLARLSTLLASAGKSLSGGK